MSQSPEQKSIKQADPCWRARAMRVVKLSLPMAGSRMINMLSGFVGSAMIAQLGHRVLAASALMGSVGATVFVIMMSIIFSVGVVIGQSYGAGENDEVGKIAQQGVMLALLLSIPLGVMYWYSPRALLWLGQANDLVVYLRQYFHVVAWIAPLIVVVVALQQFYYSVMKQNVVIVVNLIGLIFFTLSAYPLIFGYWGLPKLGVAGLAWAFIIQTMVILILLMLYIYYSPSFKPFCFYQRHNHKGWHYVRKLFSIGWPMSLQFGGELLSFLTITVMIGWLGENSLAASQVIQQWIFLLLIPVFAVSEATGILVSHAVGAKRFYELPSLGRLCMSLSAILTLTIALLFWFFPHQLAMIFLQRDEQDFTATLELVRWLFLIAGFSIFFDAQRSIITGALRGIYDTRYAMVVGLIVVWIIAVPVGYLFAFTFHMGVIGFSYARVMAFLLGALLVYQRWRYKVQTLPFSQD